MNGRMDFISGTDISSHNSCASTQLYSFFDPYVVKGCKFFYYSVHIIPHYCNNTAGSTLTSSSELHTTGTNFFLYVLTERHNYCKCNFSIPQYNYYFPYGLMRLGEYKSHFNIPPFSQKRSTQH